MRTPTPVQLLVKAAKPLDGRSDGLKPESGRLSAVSAGENGLDKLLPNIPASYAPHVDIDDIDAGAASVTRTSLGLDYTRPRIECKDKPTVLHLELRDAIELHHLSRLDNPQINGTIDSVTGIATEKAETSNPALHESSLADDRPLQYPKQIPNYKPWPLQWPFQLFIIACIVGFVGFLEHELRTLPASQFEAMGMPKRAAPGRRPLGSRAVAIPPSSLYPEPPSTTYFGWGKPVWFVENTIHPSEDPMTTHQVWYPRIPTFYTNDSSWCPVNRVYHPVPGNESQIEIMPSELLDPTQNTPDSECKSVINFISSMNNCIYPQMVGMFFRADTPTGYTPFAPLTTSADPPPDLTGWISPSTDAKGAIYMPLESGVSYGLLCDESGPQHHDIWGNEIHDIRTATFPALGPGEYVPCWNWTTDAVWIQLDSTESRSMTWWAMPITRPDRTAIASATPSTAGSGTLAPAPGIAVVTTAPVLPTSTPASPSTSRQHELQQSSSSSSASSVSSSFSSFPHLTSLPPTTVVTTLYSDDKPSVTLSFTLTPSLSSATMRNYRGQITAIAEIAVYPRPTTQTLFNAETLVPTATITTFAYPAPPHLPGPLTPEAEKAYAPLTELTFVRAAILPVLLATLLSAVVGVFTAEFGAMRPFRALTRAGGAAARDGLCLPRGGLAALAHSFRPRAGGGGGRDLLPALSVLLSVLGALLVPLASETIEMEVKPLRCGSSAMPGALCPVGLRRSEAPTRAAQGLLGLIAGVVAAMAVALCTWRSGVAADPWSVAGLASLIPQRGDAALRDLLRSVPPASDGQCVSDQAIEEALRGRRFRLGYVGRGARFEYGVSVVLEMEDQGELQVTRTRLPSPSPKQARKCWSLHSITPATQEFYARAVFLALLCGLVALILYYENTSLDTPFERFLDSQAFGVRFFFSGLGVGVTFFWEYYFSRVAQHQHYRRLSREARHAEESILLSTPTTVFTGLWRAIRTNDVFSASVSLAAFLAKFTPILLSGIPFRNTVTWKMHETCTWVAVAVLSYMLLVLVAAFLIQQPYMPVEPQTLASCMYYVCDSEMLKSFEGLALFGKGDRDRLVRTMDKRYVFGKISGVSGTRRIGVDICKETERKATWTTGSY